MPADLGATIVRRETRQTLRTSEYGVAVERVRQASAEVDRLFAEARCKVSLQRGAKSRRVTDADICRLVRGWIARMERGAVTAAMLPGSGRQDSEDLLQSHDADEGVLPDPDDPNVEAAVMSVAALLVAGRGVKGDYSEHHHDAAFAGIGPHTPRLGKTSAFMCIEV